MPFRPPMHAPRLQRGKRDRDREYDARRRKSQPWRSLYKTPQWAMLRASQLALEPLCERCAKRGLVVAATTVNHRERHRGDPIKFFDPTGLETVCKPCHDGPIQSEEKGGRGAPRGCGPDGWPLDE